MSIIYTIYTAKQNAHNIQKMILSVKVQVQTSILPFAILSLPPTTSEPLNKYRQ